MAETNTLLAGALDLTTLARITSWEGILATAPVGGDLYEFDFTPGGEWETGVAQVYTFEVPLRMITRNHQQAIADFATIMAACTPGTPVTLTRKYTKVASLYTGTASCVLSGSVAPLWDLADRGSFGCVLIFQNLSAGWTA